MSIQLLPPVTVRDISGRWWARADSTGSCDQLVACALKGHEVRKGDIFAGGDDHHDSFFGRPVEQIDLVPVTNGVNEYMRAIYRLAPGAGIAMASERRLNWLVPVVHPHNVIQCGCEGPHLVRCPWEQPDAMVVRRGSLVGIYHKTEASRDAPVDPTVAERQLGYYERMLRDPEVQKVVSSLHRGLEAIMGGPESGPLGDDYEVPRGAPGCTCGAPPFAPPEPSDDCPFHGPVDAGKVVELYEIFHRLEIEEQRHVLAEMACDVMRSAHLALDDVIGGLRTDIIALQREGA